MAGIEVQTRSEPARTATKTMRAAVVEDFTKPLVLRDVAKPAAGAGEIVVRVETSGLCHTDIHAAHGDWPVKPTPPFIPGHEGVGIVEEVGTWRRRGRAGRSRRDALARVRLRDVRLLRLRLGDPLPRAAEHGLLDRRRLRRVRQGERPVRREGAGGVSPVDAAPLTCAGVTTYKAVKVGGTRPSDLVAIFGVGGLGHLALQYARIAGGRVVAVDLREDKLELARQLGAEFTVNAAKEDPVEAIQRLGGADQAIALAVSPRAFEQAYRSLRRGGTLVFVGLPADNTIELPIFETVLNGITVVGSIVGTRVDLREVFELHAAGLTTVITEVRSLASVNDSIDDVEAGTVPARIVFVP